MRDVKRVASRGKTRNKLATTLAFLKNGERLPRSYRVHKLQGEYEGCWECHIEYDWLLIWIHIDDSTIELLRTGSHADLFKM